MSAMRIYSKKEFYAELKKNGIKKLEDNTENNELWIHSESGRFFSVPIVSEEEGIPEYTLDKYLSAIKNLSHAGDGEHIENKTYEANVCDKKSDDVVVAFHK